MKTRNGTAPESPHPSGVSRRSFLKGIGTTAVVSAAAPAQGVAEQVDKLDPERVQGPGPVPIKLKINGTAKAFELEPRVTLLEALRNHSDHTGAKEACDRGTCGACTMLVDGEPVYSCMMLAIEAQGRDVQTVEGLSEGGKLTPIQEAFVQCDAMMCGFCTPGFVMTLTALLKKNPKPTEEEVRKACSGNLCRCGTYPHILQAAQKAAGLPVTSNVEVVGYGGLA